MRMRSACVSFPLRMRMRMRMHRLQHMKPTAKPKRVPTNCTFAPNLKSWAIKYADTRHGESLSAFCERLMREERKREQDRLRKAA